jgi:hypothetical protein
MDPSIIEREYPPHLLISQSEQKIERHARLSDGTWVKAILGLGDVLRLESLECELAVEYVYRGVFDPE